MNLVYTNGLDSVDGPQFFNPDVGFSRQKHLVLIITFLSFYISVSVYEMRPS